MSWGDAWEGCGKVFGVGGTYHAVYFDEPAGEGERINVRLRSCGMGGEEGSLDPMDEN